MTNDPRAAGSHAAPATEQARSGRVPALSILGERYTTQALVRTSSLVEVYQASDIETDAEVHVHVLHSAFAASPQLREVVMNAAHEARALTHPNVLATLDVRFDGHYCFVVTPPFQASSLRALLARRAETGVHGLGARGVINVLDAVCNALALAHERAITHGNISADTVYIDNDGTVTMTDFALGPLVAAAIQAEVPGMDQPLELAPEVALSGLTSTEGDVYSLGHLLYELLIGRPLQKGGPRPSDKVPGLSPTVDELIARSANPDLEKRPTLAEFRAALRGALAAPQQQAAASASGPSLAQSLAPAGAASSPAIALTVNINPALLADTTERWLISKGRLDYGPYSTAELIEQIRDDQIMPGNLIIDNYNGERCEAQEHPIFGALVEQARQIRDDRRRANAEVVHAKQEKRRGFVLYAVIACGVLALGGIAYVVVQKTSKDEKQASAQGISTVGEGELNAKISFPTKAEKRERRKKSSGSSSGGSDEVLALDLGDESGGSERLDDAVINETISGHGSRLGGCLAKNGGGYAKIEFIIDGPTGRVTSVKLNGQQTGGLYTCVNKVMRSMKFPTVNGPRTRAEFDMSI